MVKECRPGRPIRIRTNPETTSAGKFLTFKIKSLWMQEEKKNILNFTSLLLVLQLQQKHLTPSDSIVVPRARKEKFAKKKEKNDGFPVNLNVPVEPESFTHQQFVTTERRLPDLV